MPTIPTPFYALVGVGDAAAEMARELPERIEKLDLRHFDLTKVEMPKVEMPKIELSSMEMPKVDMGDVAVYFLDVAAKAEKTYDEFVVRGEQVVARVRGTEHVTAPAKPAVKPTAKKATKKATKRPATKKATARKTTRKPAAKKAAPKPTTASA